MDILTFVPMRQLSSGDRIRIYERIRPVLIEGGFADIVARIDAAMAHERYTISLETRWEGAARRTMFAADTKSVARQVGRLVGSIHRILVSQGVGDAAQDPTVAKAQQLEGKLFPAGLQAVTHAPFVKQVAAVEEIVGTLQGDSAADAVELGLAGKVAQLATLTIGYRQAINASPQELAYEDVTEARERGLRLLANVIALIISTFSSEENAEQKSLRDRLLRLIAEQDGQYRSRLKARRRNRKAATGSNTDADSAEDGGADDVAGDAGGAAGSDDASGGAAGSDDTSNDAAGDGAASDGNGSEPQA